MWPLLPKKCNCFEEGTNTSETVNCEQCKTTNDYVYTGENLDCIGVNNQDSLTTAFQKLDFFLCGGGAAQLFITQINGNDEFIDLVNNVVDCNIIEQCGPAPTTTTTSTSTSTSSTTTTTTTVLDCNLEGSAFQIY